MKDRDWIDYLARTLAAKGQADLLLIDDRLFNAGAVVPVRPGLLGIATSIAPPPGYPQPMATVVRVAVSAARAWLSERMS